jgi:hypothetical protein
MKPIPFCERQAVTLRLRQILFVPPAPLVFAQHLDLFAAHGVDVETTQTLSSDHLGQGLADGTWDVGIAVMDNVIAWNQERSADLRIVAQLERSTVMAFCGLARYRSLAEAAMQPIAVDSTTNGFVLVLYRALARAGNRLAYLPLRSGRRRAATVRSACSRHGCRDHPRAALHRPRARLGIQKLWSGDEIAPRVSGRRRHCARRLAAGERGDDGALHCAHCSRQSAWAADASHRDAAIAALVAARYANRAAERLVRDPVPDLAPVRSGFDEVIALRRECGLLGSREPRADDVIDTGPLARAAA